MPTDPRGMSPGPATPSGPISPSKSRDTARAKKVAAGVIDAGISKRGNNKTMKTLEEDPSTPITDDRTEEAKKAETRKRNAISAAKSRLLRLVTLVERDDSVVGLGRNSALLEELLERCESLIAGTNIEGHWKAVRGEVLQKYDFALDAQIVSCTVPIPETGPILMRYFHRKTCYTVATTMSSPFSPTRTCHEKSSVKILLKGGCHKSLGLTLLSLFPESWAIPTGKVIHSARRLNDRSFSRRCGV